MNVEIRACRDRDELEDYKKIVAYVFADSSENVDKEIETTQPDWTTCAWVDGRMASTMGAFPFTVRLNGSPVKMAGVTAVGTLPQHRRQGLLRQVMRQGLATARERGQAYAILWASMGAIYQRFGYGKAADQLSYSFDPRVAHFEANASAEGSISLLTKEDGFPIAKQLYIQHASPRNLMIHRATAIWDVDTLRPRAKGAAVYVAVYRDADDEPRGYAVYNTSEDGTLPRPGPRQVLEVKDFVALDMTAYRALWDYLLRHDLVGRIQMANVLPPDDPAPELLLEPRMLNRSLADAIWMRVVDVEAAVPQRPYGGRGEVTFAIAGDDMCPWNEGTYLMETDGRTTDIRRTDRPAQLTMRPNSLATLLAGHRSATHLARAGLVEATDTAALDTADRLFHTEYAPHCPNNF